MKTVSQDDTCSLDGSTGPVRLAVSYGDGQTGTIRLGGLTRSTQITIGEAQVLVN